MTRKNDASTASGDVEHRMVGYDGAEKYTGICRNTLYNLVAQGRIPHVRLGPRFVLFDLNDLDEWLLARKVVAKDVTASARRSP